MARHVRCFLMLLPAIVFGALLLFAPPEKFRSTSVPFALSDAWALLLFIALIAFVSLLGVVREFVPRNAVESDGRQQFRATLFHRTALLWGSVLFLLMGLWIQFNGDKPGSDNGLMSCILGVSYIVICIFKYRTFDRRLTLATGGLDYSGFKFGPISWHDIERVQLTGWHPWTVRVELRDNQKYLDRPDEPWRASQLRIGAWQFGLPPEQLLASIRARISASENPPLNAALSSTSH